MAHWVAVVPNRHVSTHTTKAKAIAEIALVLHNYSRYLPSRVAEQLRQGDGVGVAYGVESEEIAKVLPCNCGSTKRHTL